jgi:hypothetical protein
MKKKVKKIVSTKFILKNNKNELLIIQLFKIQHKSDGKADFLTISYQAKVF